MRKGHLPVRTCVFCGAKKNKANLLRFVLDRGGGLVEDEGHRLGGRGAYACKKETCLYGIRNNKKAVNKAFRRLSESR